MKIWRIPINKIQLITAAAAAATNTLRRNREKTKTKTKPIIIITCIKVAIFLACFGRGVRIKEQKEYKYRIQRGKYS